MCLQGWRGGNSADNDTYQNCGTVQEQATDYAGGTVFPNNWTLVGYGLDTLNGTSGAVVHANNRVYGIHTHGNTANNDGTYMRTNRIDQQLDGHGTTYFYCKDYGSDNPYPCSPS